MSASVEFGPFPARDDPAEAWLAWADGLPLARWTGLRSIRVATGRYDCTLERSPLGLNPNGAVNGGATVAVADHVMAVVAMTGLSPEHVPVTAALHAEYHRPAFPPLRFSGTLTSAGRTLVFVTVEAHDRNDRLCLQATGTLAVRAARDLGEVQ